MALSALSLETVRAMSENERTDYFEKFGAYFDRMLTPYAIRVGQKTLMAKDTMELRQKFDALFA
jgi:hypothetical protein